MRFSVRPYLMAGVAVVAAGSIAAPPAVTPPTSPTARHEKVALTAQTRAFDVLPPALVAVRPPAPDADPAVIPKLLTEALDANAIDAPLAAQVSALAFPGVGNAIIGIYDAVMPWVDWGVNTAVYAVGWIPIVNWFTPQIDIFYYDLIRPIITSAVFNTAYVIGGAYGLGQGLTNFFNETGAAVAGFINAEINWVLSFLPPLPPLPPFFPFAAAASEAALAIEGARTAVQIPAEDAVQIEAEQGETPPAEDEPAPEPVEQKPDVPAGETPQEPVDETEPEPEPEAPEVEDLDENDVEDDANPEDKKDEVKADDAKAEDTTEPNDPKSEDTRDDSGNEDKKDDKPEPKKDTGSED